jgi:hypothetical protein
MPCRGHLKPSLGAALVLMGLLVGCDRPHGPARRISDKAEVWLQTDKAKYAMGAAIRLTLTVQNLDKASALDLEFPNPRQCDFLITDAKGQVVWRSPGPQMIVQVVTHVIVPAGGSKAYTQTASVALPAGRYTAAGDLLLLRQTVRVEAEFKIK